MTLGPGRAVESCVGGTCGRFDCWLDSFLGERESGVSKPKLGPVASSARGSTFRRLIFSDGDAVLDCR